MKPEVNGAIAVKAAYPDAVLIFLVPDRSSHFASDWRRVEPRQTRKSRYGWMRIKK